MKILCMDTSSTLCSVAVLENTTLLNKIELNNGLTHSETLMPIIKDLLSSCNLNLNDIDLLVCNIGPGSFTGIRIGVSAAKAFADVLNIPCIGINSLELLAYNIKKDGIICSTIDCKNNNCYFALYNLSDNIYSVLEEPSAISLEDVTSLISSKYSDKLISFVGDFFESESSYLNIVNLGIAGYNKFISNNMVGENILPLYLKKTQAEKQLEEKLKKASLS